MSQITRFGSGGGGGGVATLTGDAGGAIAPVLGNINLAGGSNIGTVGAGNTITINLDNTISVTGNITSTTGDVFANNITTNGDPTATLTMQDNYIFAGGLLADVDVGITTQGNGAFVIDCITGGALLSQWRTAQATVQTLNAVQTLLASVTLAEKAMVTVQATINGYKSTYDHVCAGTLYFSAYRASGGNVTLVGMVQSNPSKSNGASATVDFTGGVDVGTQTVRLYVTGAAAETWNWVTTYSYMFTLNP